MSIFFDTTIYIGISGPWSYKIFYFLNFAYCLFGIVKVNINITLDLFDNACFNACIFTDNCFFVLFDVLWRYNFLSHVH